MDSLDGGCARGPLESALGDVGRRVRASRFITTRRSCGPRRVFGGERRFLDEAAAEAQARRTGLTPSRTWRRSAAFTSIA
jgi:hypothetical protein